MERKIPVFFTPITTTVPTFTGETRSPIPGPVSLGASARRDDDGAADGGDAELPHRADRDPALLPPDFHEEGHVGA